MLWELPAKPLVKTHTSIHTTLHMVSSSSLVSSTYSVSNPPLISPSPSAVRRSSLIHTLPHTATVAPVVPATTDVRR